MLKQVERIIEIYLFPDMDMIFWPCHVIKQELEQQGAAQPAALYLEI